MGEDLVPDHPKPEDIPLAEAKQTKFRLAIVETLREEMARDERIILMGQDIGRAQGLYRLTEGLIDLYGPERVRDTPISENATVGAAIGLAIEGFRPIVEIAFSDLILTCFDTVVNQIAKIGAMLGPQVPRMPVIIRALTGAGIGAGAHHSQSLEALFAHMPGLNVVMPATAADAAGLLRSAIRSDRPTIFLEHKMLLRERGDIVPGQLTPIGSAEVALPGRDISIFAYGATRLTALAAAKLLAEDDISAEVVDLRSISPLDRAAIVASVERTGRALVVQEGYSPHGVGAEVLATIATDAWASLRAPAARISPPFTPIPALRRLEKHYLPSAHAVAEKAREICAASAVR